MGDIWITVRKAIKVALFAGIPAALGGLLNVPELVLYSPVIAGLIEAFNNWAKHRND